MPIPSSSSSNSSRHAGYEYSGKTASFSYSSIKNHDYKQIFIIGPSHYCSLRNQASLSQWEEIETPFGNLKCHSQLIEQHSKESGFTQLQREYDLKEHSIEMQYPFIHYLFGNSVPIIPILVGPFTDKSLLEHVASKLNSLIDDDTLLIFSSDFCHWGERFDYFYQFNTEIPIYKSIESMDMKGIEILIGGKVEEFEEYLCETENTICGRYPLILLLQLLKQRRKKFNAKLLHYAQSNRAKSDSDSSVSYAALMYTN